MARVLTLPDPGSEAFLRVAGRQLIIDVAGAFRWASPGDVALLDADHGLLVVNPSRADIASVRAARRAERDAASQPGGTAARR